MLTKLTFLVPYRCFPKGKTFAFRPGVNLLVGDQGTGKSTIIELLRGLSSKLRSEKELSEKTIKIEVDCPCQMISFDFEKENPRTKSWIETGLDVVCRWQSHGEIVRGILEALDTRLDKNPGLVIMDEPDMALSIVSAIRLKNQFKRLAEQGHQIIAAVHNPLIIEAQDKVLSLEHHRWMLASRFVQAMREKAEESGKPALQRKKSSVK